MRNRIQEKHQLRKIISELENGNISIEQAFDQIKNIPMTKNLAKFYDDGKLSMTAVLNIIKNRGY